MGRTKSIPRTSVSVAKAWSEGGEIEAVRQSVRKYAEVIDATESGRDMKPLITGMFEAIDRLKALEDAEAAETGDNPLSKILKMSETPDG